MVNIQKQEETMKMKLEWQEQRLKDLEAQKENNLKMKTEISNTIQQKREEKNEANHGGNETFKGAKKE